MGRAVADEWLRVRAGFLVEDRQREEVSQLRESETDRLAGLIAGGKGRRMAVRGELRARAVMAEAVVFWVSGARKRQMIEGKRRRESS